jgi:hypothetical protein
MELLNALELRAELGGEVAVAMFKHALADGQQVAKRHQARNGIEAGGEGLQAEVLQLPLRPRHSELLS